MIRRRGPNGYFLIAQCDHATISGRLAAKWGSDALPAPKPREAVVTGIEFHDAGWSMHDDKPTLNDAKEPATFYEMPVPSYLRIWVGSVSAAAARGGPMAGLIVSWHFSALARVAPVTKDQEAIQGMLAEFAAAQRLRRLDYCSALGLSRSMADDPPQAATPHDAEALYNLWLLRTCDWLSLIICDDALPEMIRRPPTPPPGVPSLNVKWPDQGPVAVPARLTIDPWPLACEKLELAVNARQIPFGPYGRGVDLARAYQLGAKAVLSFTLTPQG